MAKEDSGLSPEEEDQMLQELARKIHSRGLDSAAVLILESSKPLVWIGGEMGRFFVSPFLPAFGDDLEAKANRYINLLEQRSNIDRLMSMLDEMEADDVKRMREAKSKTPKD